MNWETWGSEQLLSWVRPGGLAVSPGSRRGGEWRRASLGMGRLGEEDPLGGPSQVKRRTEGNDQAPQALWGNGEGQPLKLTGLGKGVLG